MRAKVLIGILLLLVSCGPISVGTNKIVASTATNDSDYSILTNENKSQLRYVSSNTINFIYEEAYKEIDNKLTYRIHYADFNHIVSSDLQGLTTQDVSVQYGTNQLSIDISSLSNGYYTLEVINQKGRKYYLNFLKV